MLKKVGKVLEIKEPIHEAKIIRNFILGARVMLDVTKPFPVGRWIPRVDLIKIWIAYKLKGYRIYVSIVPS